VRPRIRTFAIGVAVVTYRSDDGVSHGATVNSFTAVSLAQTTDPDLTGPATLKVPPFAINVLSIQQRNGAVPFAESIVGQKPAWAP
jgi:flavin reductase (DIM6/NTAB) family NADH-FMN oxidoreductase RutF